MTPTGDEPTAGVFDNEADALDTVTRSRTEVQSPSQRYRLESIRWPMMWRKNTITGKVYYGK